MKMMKKFAKTVAMPTADCQLARNLPQSKYTILNLFPEYYPIGNDYFRHLIHQVVVPLMRRIPIIEGATIHQLLQYTQPPACYYG